MKKTLTILLILCASLASAANFDKRLHLYSQDYTTVKVRWVRDYVTLIDSVTITLPKDTVLTLDDAYNWSLEYRWMNAAGDSVEAAGPVITRKAITVTTNADKTGYTVSTVSDKTGYSLTQTFPTNFADLAITSSTGRVTVGTNADKTGYTASTVSDKTGYSLTQTFPANFPDLAITSSTGRVTVGTNADKTGYTASTVSDKTGYSLTTAPLTPGDTAALRANIATATWAVGTRAITDKAGFSLATAPLTPSDTAALRANIAAAVGAGSSVWTNASRDSALLALGKIDALPVPLQPSDTDEFRANLSASIGVNPWTTQKRDSVLLVLPKVDALPVPLQPSDTDEFRANISASIGVNVWTTAKRDSVLLALGKIDAANASLVKLDSAIWQAGNGEDAFSISVRTVNTDTLKFGVGSTMTHYRVYYHIGGYAGKYPDSTRTFAY